MTKTCWKLALCPDLLMRPLDFSRWRLCTSHWRPVDRGHYQYTEDTDWGPVQVDWSWCFHGVVCRAGKARARCRNWRNAAPAGWLPQENLCR